MDERLIELLEAGLTLTEAIDYIAVECDDYTQTAWGEIRGVGRQGVNNSLHRARTKVNAIESNDNIEVEDELAVVLEEC